MEINIDCDKDLVNMLLLLSHIVIAVIFIICLKTSRPVLLTLLLSLIVCFICYTVQESIVWYMLPSIGIVMFALELFINNISPEQNKKPFHIRLISSLWKMPYYSILSYYIILLYKSTTKN